ncbi:MAG: efflux RND transporter periplasmic adaptor subunit [Deltaproteobacteria bacterium]|nr:efflux RND transporter periplasmic adaptor subunit [Deltaproteobacteria bacterium]
MVLPPVEMSTEGDDGCPFKGTFDFEASSVDTQTGSLLLRASFPNPRMGATNLPKLIPGMFVRMRLPLQTIKNAILLPESAVGINQNNRYVFTVNEQGIVEELTVSVGQLEGNLRVISHGLQADDYVVTVGIQRVRGGMKVNVEEKDLPTSTPEQAQK